MYPLSYCEVEEVLGGLRLLGARGTELHREGPPQPANEVPACVHHFLLMLSCSVTTSRWDSFSCARSVREKGAMKCFSHLASLRSETWWKGSLRSSALGPCTVSSRPPASRQPNQKTYSPSSSGTTTSPTSSWVTGTETKWEFLTTWKVLAVIQPWVAWKLR
jgi:hypothetical protein